MIVQEKIIVLDFGSQYSQLIVRKVREAQVYCEIHPYNLSVDDIRKINPQGIILSGGPASVKQANAPLPDARIFELGIPVLGICYGFQVIAKMIGGEVAPSKQREYGHTNVSVSAACRLWEGLPEQFATWMSHGDKVCQVPEGFTTVAASPFCEHAAAVSSDGMIYGVQFHPEVKHTPLGIDILENFTRRVCGCQERWTMGLFIEESIQKVQQQIGDGKAICAVSGGVDSSVAAALVSRAIGDRLVCIFVDTGCMRHDEPAQVMSALAEGQGIDLRMVNAADRFLSELAGVEDPEQKRKTIGRIFIEVFQEQAQKIGKQIDYLVQGTLYPDVIESVSIHGPSAVIKSHHNVGGLPEKMHLQLVEPLRELFKDEVRMVGRQLGLPDYLINRHPFPGPGLAVRILGEVTKERCDLLRAADKIFIEELHNFDYYHRVWQAFCVLLPIRTVGVMGDERTYGQVVVVRAVNSTDGMTADWSQLPPELMRTVSNRIVGEVEGVNRVVYDITSKPPGTIEWE